MTLKRENVINDMICYETDMHDICMLLNIATKLYGLKIIKKNGFEIGAVFYIKILIY